MLLQLRPLPRELHPLLPCARREGAAPIVPDHLRDQVHWLLLPAPAAAAAAAAAAAILPGSAASQAQAPAC
jgi:hypothetical protein